jgi:oligopeptide transport system substrate-binding protein
MDWIQVPLADMDRVKSDPKLSKMLYIAPSLATYYYGFNTKAKVVDDVRVRRALSMAIDRKALIANVTKGEQEPAQWFCRPGLAGCPTMQDHPDLGIKFDVAKAKAELDAYLKEKNTTVDKLDLTVVFNTSSGHQKIAEFIQQQWKNNLGLNVKLTNQEWKVFLETTKGKDTPQIYRLGWCLDYPDANNFDREVCASGGSQNPTDAKGQPAGGFMWKDDKFEALVKQAAVEMDPAKRIELYAQAEQILVSDDAVMIPIYWYTNVRLTQPWIKRTFSVGGHELFYNWEVLQQ